MKTTIFGAKSVALATYHALRELHPEYQIDAFLVTFKSGNPETLAGLPVLECTTYADKDAYVYIAVPENIHGEIIKTLEANGFHNYICVTSKVEADLMRQYYDRKGVYESIHNTQAGVVADDLKQKMDAPKLEVYVAKFYKDKVLQGAYSLPDWQIPIQVGAELTDVRVTEICDNVGENISMKNVNYCELTALYWLWKNRVCKELQSDYYGLFHYRRILDIDDTDIQILFTEDVDVVLPYPMMCEPNIKEHHTRYIKDSDWEAMLTALRELQPEYADAYEEIFSGPYMYNYNMIIAKRDVLADYCAWLFPILERTEELSSPKGWERKDRYIGYIGENLLTLYFMYNQKNLKIRHTGRLMLV